MSTDRPMELDEFLGLDMPDYDWIVPGLLERHDRLILTSTEGGGKSTLLRQMAVQLSSGIHPFGGPEVKPLTVLLVDLENSARQVHRKLRPLRVAAGSDYAGTLHLFIRTEGLNLLEPEDRAWLSATVESVRPDVLITGPIYKLVGGDPLAEEPSRAATAALDKVRADYGCAVVLEAHTPHASNGGKRPERPYGASLWMRWPEFGIYLDPGSGGLRHWRGPRDERDWPAALKRGGEWPWSPVSGPRAAVWSGISAFATRVGYRPSIRELAEEIKVAKTTVERAIQDHAEEWEAMA